jgi:pyruvate dehydrogenase E2 component (dihydrolipoamide acetyltransferase)
VSGIKDKAVVKNGQVVPGKVMTLTISTDHRVIDGVPAAEFLNTVKLCLENPVSLVV